MNQLPLPKPVKKEKVEKWGVYRKNPKPIFTKSNKVLDIKQPEWTGDPLLEPWSVGKNLGYVSPELYQAVIDKSGGNCELCGKPGECVHHIVGRRRKAWLGNLLHLCKECHDKDGSVQAIHRTKGWVYHYVMKALQEVYLTMGYTIEQVKWLLGTKSSQLF